MVDAILSWTVIFVPVVLGVIVIAVPARHEDEKSHMRWRYALGVCLIVYGGLAWWQQSRDRSASTKERLRAVQETATETSKQVTAVVTEQFKQTVADQQKQISILQSKLDAEAKM